MTSDHVVLNTNALDAGDGLRANCTVRELTRSDSDRWMEFVNRHPGATLYHTLPWRDFIRDVFAHRPMYFLCERGEEICGVLPLFSISFPILGSKLVSIPYDIGSGGVLSADDEAETALVARSIELAHQMGVDYLQLRCGSRRDALTRLELRPSEPVLISEMQLENRAQVWAGVAKDHRKAIRKAQNRGITICDAETPQDYQAFYQAYLRVFRSFGTPPYCADFFTQLWERFHADSSVRLLLAQHQNNVVGGLLLFCHGTSLVSKFAACVPEVVPMRAYSALYWRAIELGLELGYRRLSWGTSAPSQTGLIEFKRRWGAATRPAVLYSMAVRKGIPDIERYYDSGGVVRRIWRRLPLWTTSAVGGYLSRWYC